MSAFGELGASGRTARLRSLLCRGGAFYSDEDIDIIVNELYQANPAQAAAEWKALLPPESQRVGMAAPLMVGGDEAFPYGVGLLMAQAAYAKDDLVDDAKWRAYLETGNTFGEYFTNVDRPGGIFIFNMQLSATGGGGLGYPKSLLSYRLAGGPRRVWHILGLTPSQVMSGNVGTHLALLSATGSGYATSSSAEAQSLEADAADAAGKSLSTK